MLNISASWSKPLELVDDSGKNMIYDVPDMKKVPAKPGAYIFARIHGTNLVPIYIGETADLALRLSQHLNDVRIMKGLQNAASGERVYMYCQVSLKKGQQLCKVLSLLQKALIEHALSQGYELLNTQLTKGKVNQITFSGNRESEKLFPRKMYIK